MLWLWVLWLLPFFQNPRKDRQTAQKNKTGRKPDRKTGRKTGPQEYTRILLGLESWRILKEGRPAPIQEAGRPDGLILYGCDPEGFRKGQEARKGQKEGQNHTTPAPGDSLTG